MILPRPIALVLWYFLCVCFCRYFFVIEIMPCKACLLASIVYSLVARRRFLNKYVQMYARDGLVVDTYEVAVYVVKTKARFL